MEKQEIINLIAEICQDEVVKENPNIDLFETGLLDSFGTINFLVEVDERFGINIPITEFNREEWNTPNNIAEKLVEHQ